jgi:hypothetical protein
LDNPELLACSFAKQSFICAFLAAVSSLLGVCCDVEVRGAEELGYADDGGDWLGGICARARLPAASAINANAPDKRFTAFSCGN